MKLSIPALKPRNPFVRASLQRLAGAHRPPGGALRQRGRTELRREIDRLKQSP